VGWNIKEDWGNYWAYACHYIWSWRNKEKYNDNYSRPYNQAGVVLRSLKNYTMAMNATTTTQNVYRPCVVLVRWKPPLVGWVLLDADESCREDGHIGFGGIIRGSDGEWLGGSSKYIGIESAYVAELWGLLEGLMYARSLQFKFIEVHVDSLAVMQVVSSHENGSWKGRTLVEKIRRLLALDWEVVVHHSYREANCCADALANYGCSLTSGFSFFDVCPSSINNLLFFDLLGYTTPRVISS
ncbi:ribonuclease H, partial [Trifolium pratense]